jgi:hypothetical protein
MFFVIINFVFKFPPDDRLGLHLADVALFFYTKILLSKPAM